jgi:hypothetical protein
MRFRALSLVAGVAVLALTAGGVLAGAGTLDQHQDTHDSGGFGAADYPTAQTFTAGLSGQLNRVSLYGTEANLGDRTLTVRIESVDGSGHPTGTLLSPGATTTAIPLSGWFDADFSTGPSVVADSKYAIVFGAGDYFMAAGTCTEAYAGGEALAIEDTDWAPIAVLELSCIADFAFRTYVGSAVIAPPSTSAAFGAATIALNSSTSLTFTITNPNASSGLTGVGFTDTLPAGLLIATPNNIGGSCGGAITATAGTNLVAITGLTLAAGATCGFGVDVIGVAAGTQANTTSAITSTEGGPGDPATASITVTALSTPAPIPTPTPATTLAPAPTPTPTPRSSATPPPTSTGENRGPGGESPLLPLLAMAAVAAIAATTFVLRSEPRVHHR